MPTANTDELSNYYEKFEQMQRWMVDDLRNASIKAHANLLVGMGIFNYIEILGSFYYWEKSSSSQKRFDFAFSQFMGSPYNDIYHKLNSLTTKGSYDVLRCGLTHEYLIKSYRMKNPGETMQFTIYGVNDDVQYMHTIASKNCGIELITIDQMHYHLRIYNPRLIYDLNLAFEGYKNKIRANASNHEGNFRERFIKRCQNINFKNFN